MTVAGIVPVNSLEQVKSRLASVVSDRGGLALRLMQGVVRALKESGCLARVLVVSPDARVERAALASGAEFLLQHGSGLNPALVEARDYLAGSEALLVALADLPDLRAEEVQALVGALHSPGVVLAPDAAERGTNLLLLSPPGALDFHFGPDSLEAHRREALARGLRCQLFRSPGTSHDLDTPEQLRALSWN